MGRDDGDRQKWVVASLSSSSSTRRESQLDAGLSQPREDGLEAGLGLRDPVAILLSL